MAASPAQIEARRRALAANSQRYDRLRALHAQIAHNISIDPIKGAELVGRARQRIEKWVQAETCNPYYVRAWRRILRSHPEAGLKDLVEGVGGMRNAMLQNSPFSFALGDGLNSKVAE